MFAGLHEPLTPRSLRQPCGSLAQSYGRAASRGELSICNHQEQTDDLSFAARHAPFELLERRGFAAHPCAARPLL